MNRRTFFGALAALPAAIKAMLSVTPVAAPLNVTDVVKGQLPTEVQFSESTACFSRASVFNWVSSGEIAAGDLVYVDGPYCTRNPNGAAVGIALEDSTPRFPDDPDSDMMNNKIELLPELNDMRPT